MMSSPILAFLSPPASPTHTPVPVSRAATMKSESRGSNVTLFTHQDGKRFEVTIVRIDEAVDLDSDNLGSYREENWDSDDWDEDAEDWAEPTPQQHPPQLRLHRAAMEATTEECHRPEESRVHREDHRTVDDWDGDAQDLEEKPVTRWSERPDRPDWVRRERDADVWRTRLGDD